MKLIIDRKQWLHGEGSGKNVSKLLREADGKMCCLGFYALYKRHSRDEILNKSCPWSLEHWKGMGEDLVCSYQNESIYDIYDIYSRLMVRNDSMSLSDNEREEQIKQGFLDLDGTEVEFIGEY